MSFDFANVKFTTKKTFQPQEIEPQKTYTASSLLPHEEPVSSNASGALTQTPCGSIKKTQKQLTIRFVLDEEVLTTRVLPYNKTPFRKQAHKRLMDRTPTLVNKERKQTAKANMNTPYCRKRSRRSQSSGNSSSYRSKGDAEAAKLAEETSSHLHEELKEENSKEETTEPPSACRTLVLSHSPTTPKQKDRAPFVQLPKSHSKEPIGEALHEGGLSRQVQELKSVSKALFELVAVLRRPFFTSSENNACSEIPIPSGEDHLSEILRLRKQVDLMDKERRALYKLVQLYANISCV